MSPRLRNLVCLLPSVALAAAAGCLDRFDDPTPRLPTHPGAPAFESAPMAPVASGPVGTSHLSPPVVTELLNRGYREAAGLLRGLGPDGTPTLVGAGTDPMILEARRFYDTVGTPGRPHETAPMTLADWKRSFGFADQKPGESLQDFRDRTDVTVYYNKNELGLGRELGCAEFVDGLGPDGQPQTGIACFVTNYGTSFRDRHASLRLAADGRSPRNTVCITHRPSMPQDYQVQFYVYGWDGHRLDWAQLDTYGGRPHPQVCTNCHGGVYDETKHLARFARFLPMDPELMEFPTDKDGYDGRTSRSAQEERIRATNALSLRTPLTPAQIEYFQGIYGGHLETPGTKAVSGWAPKGWDHTQADHDFYAQVIKPYCATCHLASQNGLDGSELFTYRLFLSSEAFERFPSTAVVCNSFAMPNAQATQAAFWDPAGPGVTIAGQHHPTPADAYLSRFGSGRAKCTGLNDMKTCNRGPDPDAVCGNISSGAACNRKTGQCVPALGSTAPASLSDPRGFCQPGGKRGCPRGEDCRAIATPVEGLEAFAGACFACGRIGTMACTSGAACEPGLNLAGGSCVAVD